MYYTINKRSTFNADLFSGEEGIRTPVTLAGKHIFETCAIIHSATSPDAEIISAFYKYPLYFMSINHINSHKSHGSRERPRKAGTYSSPVNI